MKNSPSSSISTNAASDKALDLQGNFVVPCFSRTKKRHLLQLLISAGAHLFPGHVKFILLKGLEFSGFIHDEILKHAWFNPVPPCDLPLILPPFLTLFRNSTFVTKSSVWCKIRATGRHDRWDLSLHSKPKASNSPRNLQLNKLLTRCCVRDVSAGSSLPNCGTALSFALESFQLLWEMTVTLKLLIRK